MDRLSFCHHYSSQWRAAAAETLITLLSQVYKKLRRKLSNEVKTAGCVNNIMYRGGDRLRSRDLATITNFLVTCVQPEMLHISHHYEWLHLPPEYLTRLQIRLQITGELLISIDYHELVWSAVVWGRDKHFHRNRYVDFWLYDRSFIDLWRLFWIMNGCRGVIGHISSLCVMVADSCYKGRVFLWLMSKQLARSFVLCNLNLCLTDAQSDVKVHLSCFYFFESSCRTRRLCSILH